MKYRFNDKVAILVNGKIVKQFKVKQTTPICNLKLKQWVLYKWGDAFNNDGTSFELMKMGS